MIGKRMSPAGPLMTVGGMVRGVMDSWMLAVSVRMGSVRYPLAVGPWELSS